MDLRVGDGVGELEVALRVGPELDRRQHESAKGLVPGDQRDGENGADPRVQDRPQARVAAERDVCRLVADEHDGASSDSGPGHRPLKLVRLAGAPSRDVQPRYEGLGKGALLQVHEPDRHPGGRNEPSDERPKPSVDLVHLKRRAHEARDLSQEGLLLALATPSRTALIPKRREEPIRGQRQ